MDARFAAPAASLCLLVLIAGCVQQTGSPTAQRTAVDTPPIIEPDDVDSADEAVDAQTVGDMEPVQRWIEQIERLDDLRSRVTRQPVEPELSPLTETPYEQEPPVASPLPQGRVPDAADDPPGSASDGAAPSGGTPTGEATSESGLTSETAEDGARIPGPEPPSTNAQSSAAPILGHVSARAAEFIPSGVPSPGEGSPGVNAPVRAAGQQLTLEEFAEQWLAQPANTSFEAQLDRRLLLVLAGNYDEARRPLEMVSNEQQQMAGEFVEALIAIREGHDGDPGAAANRALVRVEALAEALVPLSDLRISTLVLTRTVRGFGRYETFDPPQFLAGRENEFVVYCEIGNFVSRPAEAGGYESQFSMRTGVLNRAGDVVLEINDDHIPDECRARRHDCFIPRLVRLPATLSPGEYVVKVTIIDKIAGKVAEKRTTFRIIARS